MQKGLIIVHREESAEDFKEIAQKIKHIDPSIKGAMVSEWIFEEEFPQQFFEMPLLVVYLVNPPSLYPDQFIFPNATNISVGNSTKLEEYEHFKKHNIPCLPIEKFEWGMRLDENLYGDWVVLKPANIQSTGKDVNMIPTGMIPKLKIEDFPKGHLISKDDYLVQKFIRTGPAAISYRSCIFLDQVIYSRRSNMTIDLPSQNESIYNLLNRSVATNDQQNRVLQFHIDDEVNQLAIQVAKTLTKYPIFGIDILRDVSTGSLYVLESNLGGNVWHFSSKLALDRGLADRDVRISQYGAWDRVAESLVRKVHEVL